MRIAMQAKLVVVGGDSHATEFELELPSVLGRGREATVTLGHSLVSRKHCQIFESEGKLMVRDLGSMNGTYVHNRRIDCDTELLPGDLLTIGAVTFRAVYEVEKSQGKSDTVSEIDTVANEPIPPSHKTTIVAEAPTESLQRPHARKAEDEADVIEVVQFEEADDSGPAEVRGLHAADTAPGSSGSPRPPIADRTVGQEERREDVDAQQTRIAARPLRRARPVKLSPDEPQSAAGNAKRPETGGDQRPSGDSS
jgi:pSer/pThr/pTyr-binding forkhead associated (FHA) protein